MNATQQRVEKVLLRMIEMVKAEQGDAETFSALLEDMLSDIHSGDGFGTEGQCDPRGDFRDGDWSMDFVQGVDS